MSCMSPCKIVEDSRKQETQPAIPMALFSCGTPHVEQELMSSASLHAAVRSSLSVATTPRGVSSF